MAKMGVNSLCLHNLLGIKCDTAYSIPLSLAMPKNRYK